MWQTIDVEYGLQSAALWLSRPEHRNALDPRMVAELTEALGELAGDETVRAVVLGGRGGTFCAGTDLAWVRQASRPDLAENGSTAMALTHLLTTLYEFPKPTVARIQGRCMGGGMALAAACDIAVASREATFGLPETRLDLIPSIIAPYVLHAMGARAASRWFLTGESFSAAEAWRTGFIHDLCESDELDVRISALSGGFMITAPDVMSASKKLIRDRAGASDVNGRSAGRNAFSARAR